jgi:hypothetical protein
VLSFLVCSSSNLTRALPSSDTKVDSDGGNDDDRNLIMAKRAGVVMLLAVAFNTCLVPVRPSPLVSYFATSILGESILELHGNLLPLQRVAFLCDLVGGTHVNAIKMRSDQEKSNCA